MISESCHVKSVVGGAGEGREVVVVGVERSRGEIGDLSVSSVECKWEVKGAGDGGEGSFAGFDSGGGLAMWTKAILRRVLNLLTHGGDGARVCRAGVSAISLTSWRSGLFGSSSDACGFGVCRLGGGSFHPRPASSPLDRSKFGSCRSRGSDEVRASNSSDFTGSKLSAFSLSATLERGLSEADSTVRSLLLWPSVSTLSKVVWRRFGVLRPSVTCVTSVGFESERLRFGELIVAPGGLIEFLGVGIR